MKNKHKIIFYHTIFWVTYMLLGNILEYAQDPVNYFFSITDVFFTQFPNICTVYLCTLVCFKYGNPLKPFLLICGIILVFIFSLGNWYVTSQYIRPLIRAVGPPPHFNLLHFGASVLWVFIRYSILGIGYYFASEGIKRERKLRLIEKEKHHAEYAFLRAQINPHFLYNTLNFFYAKSLPLSAELAGGIMTLSEIMHYSLKQDREEETTLLDEEIAHIKNVININQLRFNHQLHIDFKISGNTANFRIIPLILITIVENVLKHGNCADELNPAKIRLSANDNNGNIHLKTYNTKKKGPKELSSGIGMKNISKRLNHHYGRDFLLSIHETETDYKLEMILYDTTVIDTT